MSQTVVVTITRSTRMGLMIGSAVAVLFGIAILVWPTKTAVAVTALIAVWAAVAGVTFVLVSISAKGTSTGSRIGHLLLGLLYLVAAAFAFSELHQTAAWLAVFVTILVGVMWILEGFVSLFTLGEAGRSQGLTILFAIVSIVAGVVLLTSPLWAASFLWCMLGIALLVLGAIGFIRAALAPTSSPATVATT
jgi:uncharacterized membrane protein HdeD (DUF308 family)